MTTGTVVKPKSLAVHNLMAWEGLEPESEVAWLTAPSSRAHVQVSGDFGRVALEGTLDPDVESTRVDVITRAMPFTEVRVPLYVRPRVLEGTAVTVHIHFPR